MKSILIAIIILLTHCAPVFGQVSVGGEYGSHIGGNAHSGSTAPAKPAGPLVSSIPLGPEEKPFHVGKVGEIGVPETRDKLLELFTQIQRNYTVNDKSSIISKPSLVGSTTITISKVTQIAAPALFVCDKFAVQTLQPQDWVIGKGGMILNVVDNGSYTIQAGAAHVVKFYKEVGGEPGPTQAQFVTSLKNGQKFVVHLSEMRDPPPKLGDPALGKLNGQAPPQVAVDVTYTISW